MGNNNYIEYPVSNKELIDLISVIGANFNGDHAYPKTKALLFQAVELLNLRVKHSLEKESK